MLKWKTYNIYFHAFCHDLKSIELFLKRHIVWGVTQTTEQYIKFLNLLKGRIKSRMS